MDIKTYIQLIAILTFYFESISLQLVRDCMEPYCVCLDATSLLCTNFTNFAQLNFSLVNGRRFESVEIRPFNIRLDLNENLNFNGLQLNGRLTLSNLNSLAAFYNPFRQILYDRFNLAILNSNFKFVGGNTGNFQAESSILNECKFQSSAQNFNYIFSNLRIEEFTLGSIFFEQTICPILFRNTRIFNFLINDPYGAFGFQNLTTELFSNDVSLILNANVRQIYFDYAKSTNVLQKQWLDAQSIINPGLFEQLDRVNLNSARRLSYIQEDTFKLLKNVRKLEIKNINIKDLLSRNRRWLKNLNYNMPTYDIDHLKLNSSMASSIFQLIIWVDNEWQFNDDKDICLFRNFPHNKLVFPFLLFSQTSLPCTCTLFWLYKHLPKYQALYNLNQNNVPFHCFKQSNWDNCRFEALFNRWCPSAQDDPDESFTTLKPNTNVIPNFSTSTNTQFTSLATFSNAPVTFTTLTFSRTSTTVSSISSSAIPFEQNSSSDANISTASFYITIILSILTVFMIIILVILYCKTLYPENLGVFQLVKSSKNTLNIKI